ncbi:hypothetical protein N865_18145 [Intrasporangium oryzae NRRL B-24470]|uniref:Uncharacterized protein n=1 Tax=Intrasporangium oryzae NRRL B-24470 TaxID=1386089 RepID=W9G4A8_9MICO|nr:hypothetical protein [Intrasporangium oryzae]EWT00137.1 hypothetical protein N865_18145 [Intrasporangium oryzae NRRL B-24470]
MIAALISQTPPPTGFSPTGLIIVLVVAAIVYPLQKKLRESVSRERKERWARENPVDVIPTEPSPQDLGEESS